METPSVSAVFSATWAGVPAIFKSRPKFYWAWVIAAAVVGALALLTPANAFYNPQSTVQVTAAVVPNFIAYGVMLAVLVYFMLADAVRTIVPAFRMTPQIFIITVLLNMAYSMAIQFAMYVLIIPAFYVGPKLWLWTPNYLLTSENTDVGTNLTHAWRDTNNVYWPTLGFMALIFFVSIVIEVFAICIGLGAIQLFAPSGIVMLPFTLAVTMFACALTYLGWMNWAVAIRKHADALLVAVPQAAPVQG